MVLLADRHNLRKGTDMALNPSAVGAKGDPVEITWDSKDCLLYAVGIGAGADELAFTTENTADVVQQVFPTFPVVLGWGKGSPMKAVGEFDPALLVHGQQAVTPARALPTSGSATMQSEIVAMYDKGKAAVVVSETTLTDGSGVLCTLRSSAFVRGAGGWGAVIPATSDGVSTALTASYSAAFSNQDAVCASGPMPKMVRPIGGRLA